MMNAAKLKKFATAGGVKKPAKAAPMSRKKKRASIAALRAGY